MPLLLQIDALPSHVVVVVATNHAELLDRAVWRRFQLRLQLPPPTLLQKEAWFKRFEDRLGTGFGVPVRTLTARLKASSYSDLEQFCEDVHRRYVLALPNANLKRIVSERLRQWQARAAAGKQE